jgi:hypothetical protein
MDSVGSLSLIHFLDFYFAFMFLLGIWRRFGQYQNVAKLVLAGPSRWPHLMKLVSQYRTIFWTWATMGPALAALALWLLQVLASRLLFPSAGSQDGLTIARLLELWPALFVVVPLAFAMFGFDFYSLYVAGEINREQLENHFDQAEFWLRSKTANVVRVVSFGYLNPRRMVAQEVEKALLAVSGMLNFTLWWVALQIGLRFVFGASLWLTWAVTR